MLDFGMTDRHVIDIRLFMRLECTYIYIHDIRFNTRKEIQKHACIIMVFNRYIVSQSSETHALHK